MAFFDDVKLSSSSLTNVPAQVFNLSDLRVSFVSRQLCQFSLAYTKDRRIKEP